MQFSRGKILHLGAKPLLYLFTAFEPRPHSGVPLRDPAAARLARFHPLVDRARAIGIAAQRDGAAGEKRKVRRDVVAFRSARPIFNPSLKMAAAVDSIR